VEYWYKCDLQVASPGGRFSLPGANPSASPHLAAAQWVDCVTRAGLDCVVVADHNSVAWVDRLRAAAPPELTVLPGVELTTGSGSDGVHLILVADPGEVTQPDFDAMLDRVCGFDSDHPRFNVVRPSEPLPARRSLFDILDELPEHYLVIAPHAFNDNGVASPDTLNGTLRWRALHQDRLSAVDIGVPAEDDSGNHSSYKNKFRRRELDNFQCLDRLAFVSTSDAYREEQLGGRYTWIRMRGPSFEGLRQAFLDPFARICCGWQEGDRFPDADPNKIRHGWIESVRMSGIANSESQLSVTLDPRLTVLIGGRGAGKSTVVHALRELYGRPETLPESLRNEISAFTSTVFPDAEITATHRVSISGESEAVIWTRATGPLVHDDLGKHAPILHARVVGQKELFERTNAAGGQDVSDNLLTLVDEALGLDAVTSAASGRASLLARLEDARSNYGAIVSHRLTLGRQLAQRPSVAARHAELAKQIEALEEPALLQQRDQVQAAIGDERSLIVYAQQLRDWANALERASPGAPDFITAEALALVEGVRANINELIDRQTAVITAVRELAASLDAARATGEFSQIRQSAQLAWQQYETQLTELGVDPGQLASLRDQSLAAQDQLDELDALVSEYGALIERETHARAEMKELHEERREARRGFLREVEDVADTLRFTLVPHGDASSFVRKMRSLLGFRADGYVEVVPTLAAWLFPGSPELPDRQQIWQSALLDGEWDPLAAAFRAPAAFWDRLRQADETVRIALSSDTANDLMDMRFRRDGTEGEQWQSITSGSPGQRSAAMLSFMLSHGDEPLILDQPEDDLDSEWVTHLIVKQLRAARWRRQLIVVTHNANIPVNCDAERVVVLDNRENRLQVRSDAAGEHAGPLELEHIRTDIQDLLEGGVRAFVDRERRYDNELNRYRETMAMLRQRSEPAT